MFKYLILHTCFPLVLKEAAIFFKPNDSGLIYGQTSLKATYLKKSCSKRSKKKLSVLLTSKTIILCLCVFISAVLFEFRKKLFIWSKNFNYYVLYVYLHNLINKLILFQRILQSYYIYLLRQNRKKTCRHVGN